jgi:single-strand DNA-binding protein
MFDVPVTIVGNVLTAPEWRRVGSANALVANFKVASTTRRYDRDSGKWVDGPSLRVRVNCWRRLAEGVASSVMVGDPIIVTGRLYTRDWLADDGQRRLSYELEAGAVGHDLARGQGSFRRHRGTTTTSSVDDSQADARVNGEMSTFADGPAARAEMASSGYSVESYSAGEHSPGHRVGGRGAADHGPVFGDDEPPSVTPDTYEMRSAGSVNDRHGPYPRLDGVVAGLGGAAADDDLDDDGPDGAEPAGVEPMDAEVADAEVADAEPADAEVADAEPADPEPADPEPLGPSSAAASNRVDAPDTGGTASQPAVPVDDAGVGRARRRGRVPVGV